MKTHIISLLMLISAQLFSQSNQWLTYNQSNTGLPSNSIKAIDFDEGNAWVGTISGLAINDAQDWDVYNTSNSSLENNYIRCIAIDNTGTKWIGTSNGLVSINGSPNERSWSNYNTGNSGLPINNITAVAVDGSNRKWFGTWGGGVSTLYNGVWQNYDMYTSPLPVNGIYDIKADAYNMVWIASHGGGLTRYDGLNWHTFNTSNSNLPSDVVYSIDFDNQNNIWLGTDLGLVKFDRDSHWTLYNSGNTGWNFTGVLCVKYEAATQKLYFGTYNGMGIYENGVFNFKKTSNSPISHNWVSVISIDGDGNKWVGTLGGGISVYNENGITISTEELTSTIETGVLTAYPNPTQGHITFEFTAKENSYVILKIYDLTGQLQRETSIKCRETGLQSITLNISEMASGLYYYSIENGENVHTSKLVKI